MNQITALQGRMELVRYPVRQNDLLRAWDAADEFLLHYLEENTLLDATQKLLIINDSFGALTCCLHEYHPFFISDSYLAVQGTLHNLRRNHLETDGVTIRDGLQLFPEKFGIVLIKIPKSLALLKDQLIRLRQNLHPGSVIIAGGMVKHISATAISLFETIIGPTQTTLARKKARLIISHFAPSKHIETEPESFLNLPEFNLSLFQHPGVFSMNKLDLGSRLFLEHLSTLPQASKIIDLGCGNGVLGLAVARQQVEAELTFIDESYRAVDSARINFTNNFPGRQAHFLVNNCLDEVPRDSVSLIINNPPFHQQQVVGDQIAWQMFRQSRQILERSGQLWVVGNRHLGYHTKLKRLFGNCKLMASTHKFVLLSATKS